MTKRSEARRFEEIWAAAGLNRTARLSTFVPDPDFEIAKGLLRMLRAGKFAELWIDANEIRVTLVHDEPDINGRRLRSRISQMTAAALVYAFDRDAGMIVLEKQPPQPQRRVLYRKKGSCASTAHD